MAVVPAEECFLHGNDDVPDGDGGPGGAQTPSTPTADPSEIFCYVLIIDFICIYFSLFVSGRRARKPFLPQTTKGRAWGSKSTYGRGQRYISSYFNYVNYVNYYEAC